MKNFGLYFSNFDHPFLDQLLTSSLAGDPHFIGGRNSALPFLSPAQTPDAVVSVDIDQSLTTGDDSVALVASASGGVGEVVVADGTTVLALSGNDSIDDQTDYASTTIVGGATIEDLYTTPGSADAYLVGYDEDTIHGNGGNDSISGNFGADILYGDAGDDSVDGGWLNDLVEGGDGNDILYGGEGDDTVNGGTGNDLIFGEKDPALPRNWDSYVFTTYTNTFDDTLQGNEGNDTIFGQEGNDTIGGGQDDDYLDGGEGDDSLLGGNGFDVMAFSGTFGNDTVSAGEQIIVDGVIMNGSEAGWATTAGGLLFTKGSNSVLIEDWSETNNYGLALPGNVVETTDAPDDISTGYEISPGDQVLGSVDVGGDDDWYRIDLSTNYSYYFTLSGDGTASQLLDAQIELWNGAGTSQIALDSDGSLVSFAFTPSASGTYYVSAAGDDSSDVGDYELLVLEEIVDTINTLATISADSTVSGSVDYGGDEVVSRRWWKFEGGVISG